MDSTGEQTYRVVFYGSLDEERGKEDITAALTTKIKMSEKAATSLLSSRKAIVKKNLPLNAAEKYKMTFERVGVYLEIEPMPAPASVSTPAPAPIPEEPEEQPSPEPEEQPSTITQQPTSQEETSPFALEPKEEPETDSTEEESSVDDSEYAQESVSEDMPDAEDDEVNEESQSVGTEAFSFEGNGGEYFKIWIVNILLTILTLGIYSAWAKVRNHQYFYGHTEVASGSFQYLATPISILIGRLIVVPVVVIGNILSNFIPMFAIVFGIFVIAVLPWVFYRSLRFNLRNTSYRNIRFDFQGGYWGAAAVIYLWPILGTLTLGLLMPLSVKKMQTYIANNSLYGQTPFMCDPPTKEYYICAAMFIAAIAVGYGVGTGLGFIFPPLLAVGALVGYVVAIALWTAGTTNLYFNNTTLAEHGFTADYEVPGLIKLYLVNTIGMVLTLGLFYPWAKVRIARYKAEHTYLDVEGDLDAFINSEETAKSSIGEELGEALDVDVAAF